MNDKDKKFRATSANQADGNRIVCWPLTDRLFYAFLIACIVSSIAFPRRVVAVDATATSSDGLRFLKEVEQQAKQISANWDRSIVSIACVARGRNANVQGSPLSPNQSTRFGINDPNDHEFIAARYATGIVWDNRGSIVTTYSSLGDPNDHEYFIWNRGASALGRLVGLQAEVIGGEPYTNLAVLRVLDDGFANTCKPIPRDTVIEPMSGAICFHLSCPGSYSRDGQPAIQWGVINNTNRSIPSLQESADRSRKDGLDRSNIYAHAGLFQTSHVDHFGTAAAAMVDLQGNFLGLSVDGSLIEDRQAPGVFALPYNNAFRRIVEALADGKLPTFGFMGIQPGQVESQLTRRNIQGVLVSQVIPGMPAEEAGLRAGDVITHIGNRGLETRDAVFRELAGYAANDQVPISITRPRGSELILIDATVRLSKRYMAADRPAFAKEMRTSWRGAEIDYATALPPDLLLLFLQNQFGKLKTSLIVMNVELDSPAWNAGLRMGNHVLAVDQTPIDSLEQFDQLTGKSDASVQLSIRNSLGKDGTINVAPLTLNNALK